MKPNRPCLLLAAFLLSTLPLPTQVSALDAKKSGVENRLALALKLFPDADADKDGTLSVNEALAYLDAHPEVKELLQTMTGGGSSSKPAAFAPGTEGTRVFVCGHSYMIFTAGMLPAVSKFAGIAYLNAGQQMIGGSQVIQHWNLPDEKNQAKKALREGIVDVLMLSPNLLLPDEGIDHFTKLGLETNPKLRVLVQASWVPWDGKAGAGFKNEMRDAVTADELRGMREFHHNGWLRKLETQVNALNDSVGKETVHIVPVSAAVFALRERVAEGKAPGVAKQSELFKDDHGHPAPPLALLVTYCHFAAIHQRSPVGLPVPDSIKDRPQAAELNLLLQQIARDAVSNYPLSGVKGTAANRAPTDALPARENYLLLDSRVIAASENARLVPGPVTKHPANPLMREDRPWEVRFDNLYANVIHDARSGLYRCWYSPFIVDPAVRETPPAQRATVRYQPRDREMGICYAESRDGLKWEKPAASTLVHPDAPPMLFPLSDGKTLVAFHHNKVPTTGNGELSDKAELMKMRSEVWASLSTDGGHTWSEPRFVLANAVTPVHAVSGFNSQCSYLDAFTENGVMHLFMPHRWQQVLHLTIKEDAFGKLPTKAQLQKIAAPAAKAPIFTTAISAKLEPTRRVVYKKVGDRELALDIFEPADLKKGDKRACFVAIHGGGWTSGSPRTMYAFADHCTKLGMVAISVQYRLYKAKTPVTVFECVKDARASLRYVRAHAAELGIDPQKIIANGASAGGHLAAATAMFDDVDHSDEDVKVSSHPNALVLFSPVIDTSLEGYGNAKIGERWQELSPAHKVRAGLPPTLHFHGDGDTTTPIKGAQIFVDAMNIAGNRIEFVSPPAAIHTYMFKDAVLYAETLKKMDDFFAELGLVKPN